MRVSNVVPHQVALTPGGLTRWPGTGGITFAIATSTVRRVQNDLGQAGGAPEFLKSGENGLGESQFFLVPEKDFRKFLQKDKAKPSLFEIVSAIKDTVSPVISRFSPTGGAVIDTVFLFAEHYDVMSKIESGELSGSKAWVRIGTLGTGTVSTMLRGVPNAGPAADIVKSITGVVKLSDIIYRFSVEADTEEEAKAFANVTRKGALVTLAAASEDPVCKDFRLEQADEADARELDAALKGRRSADDDGGR